MLEKILQSLSSDRNVLVYGPPGTGKTRLLSQLFDALRNTQANLGSVFASPGNLQAPLTLTVSKPPIASPVKVYWSTFHQSFGYEDFVLGQRPVSTAQGIVLKPFAGVLLDAVCELLDQSSLYESAVIFIDEINRGNASRIFGELITFLDFEYRVGGKVEVPMPLRQLSYPSGMSEPVTRLDGTQFQLEEGFAFPRNIYIVATMNSVDRAAVPIDSALARRFTRVELAPSRDVLQKYWALDDPTFSGTNEARPYTVAAALFTMLNDYIAADLGADFELGHGLFMKLLPAQEIASSISTDVESEGWRLLAQVWDDSIYPQLEDRFSGRPNMLIELLRVEGADSSYAWRFRETAFADPNIRSLQRVHLSDQDVEVIRDSFSYLVGIDDD